MIADRGMVFIESGLLDGECALIERRAPSVQTLLGVEYGKVGERRGHVEDGAYRAGLPGWRARAEERLGLGQLSLLSKQVA